MVMMRWPASSEARGFGGGRDGAHDGCVGTKRGTHGDGDGEDESEGGEGRRRHRKRRRRRDGVIIGEAEQQQQRQPRDSNSTSAATAAAAAAADDDVTAAPPPLVAGDDDEPSRTSTGASTAAGGGDEDANRPGNSSGEGSGGGSAPFRFRLGSGGRARRRAGPPDPPGVRRRPPPPRVSTTVSSSVVDDGQHIDDDDPFGGGTITIGLNGGADDGIPCDALLAVRSIVQRGAHGIIGPLAVPFVLRSMVHDVMLGGTKVEGSDGDGDVAASTGIAEELDRLAASNLIRLLRLKTGGVGVGGDDDEEAIVETGHYSSEVRRAISTSSDPQTLGPDGEDLARRFLSVLESIPRSSASEDDILRCLADSPALATATTADGRKEIDLLVSLGLLSPRRDASRSGLLSTTSSSTSHYWFTLPHAGEASRSISRGRSEMVLRLKRTRYREMRRSKLESMPMKKSTLSGAFHVRDLLSTGRLVLRSTPSGETFVRLPPDGRR